MLDSELRPYTSFRDQVADKLLDKFAQIFTGAAMIAWSTVMLICVIVDTLTLPIAFIISCFMNKNVMYTPTKFVSKPLREFFTGD